MDIDIDDNFYNNNNKYNESQTLTKHQGIVWNIAWNPVEDILISCGADKNIYIWALKPDSNDVYVPKVISSCYK